MNPFLDRHNEEEGSLTERFLVKRALRSNEESRPDVDSDWERLRARIEESEQTESLRHRRRRLMIWICAAAVLTVAFVTLGVAYFLPEEKSAGGLELYVADVPEVESIVLKTSGGVRKTVPRQKSGVSPMKLTEVAAADEKMIVETPAGQEISLQLSDSTVVWLWPNSRLEYPVRFSGGERVVTLRGQAYFDVASKSDTLFSVKTEYFTTKVYGTEFVVRASGLRESDVVLIEGSVGVSADDGEKEAVLKSGQEAKLTAEGFEVEDIDPYPVSQWKDGLFYFDEDELIEVLVTLGKWYGVSIVAHNEEDLHRKVHFVADRTDDIGELVKSLNSIIPDSELVYKDRQISLY